MMRAMRHLCPTTAARGGIMRPVGYQENDYETSTVLNKERARAVLEPKGVDDDMGERGWRG